MMEETINIDEGLWEKAKIEAEKRGISADEIIKQALEVFLGSDTKKIPLNKVFKEICILVHPL